MKIARGSLILGLLLLPSQMSWRGEQALRSAFLPARLSHPSTRDKGPTLLQVVQVDPDRNHWRPSPAHPATRDRGPGAVLVADERDRVTDRPDRDHPPVRCTGPVPSRGD